jgi:hypothetical protein
MSRQNVKTKTSDIGMEIEPVEMGLARPVAATDALRRLAAQALDPGPRVPAERPSPLPRRAVTAAASARESRR